MSTAGPGEQAAEVQVPAPASATAPHGGTAPARARVVSRRRWELQSVAVTEEEGWLLTYLDVITLLLVMMVVMLSFSQPADRQKAAKTAASGVQIRLPQVPRLIEPIPGKPPQGGDTLGLGNLGKDIQVSVEQGIVRFRIDSEILFASGQAGLVGPGPGVLESLVPVLERAAGQRVVVEGHTDSIPIQTDRFPSNWELSSARASSVARFLIERGVDPARIRVSGLADTLPIADNQDPSRRAANRRVELILETGPEPRR